MGCFVKQLKSNRLYDYRVENKLALDWRQPLEEKVIRTYIYIYVRCEENIRCDCFDVSMFELAKLLSLFSWALQILFLDLSYRYVDGSGDLVEPRERKREREICLTHRHTQTHTRISHSFYTLWIRIKLISIFNWNRVVFFSLTMRKSRTKNIIFCVFCWFLQINSIQLCMTINARNATTMNELTHANCFLKPLSTNCRQQQWRTAANFPTSQISTFASKCVVSMQQWKFCKR